jgi:predicted O-methyltransferase YrrM
LVEVISKCLGIPKKIYGISPLNTSGDKYSSYEDDDYMTAIRQLFNNLEASMDDTELIVGYSTDATIKDRLKSMDKFDLIYIDGSHDYIDVVSDIDLANECLRPGGFLVLDDASSRINLGTSPKFWGHEDVAQAIEDKLVDNAEYKHLMALGHNRVFKKI